MKASASSDFTNPGTQTGPEGPSKPNLSLEPAGSMLSGNHAAPPTPTEAAKTIDDSANKAVDRAKRIQGYLDLWEEGRRKKNERIRESKRRIQRFEYADKIRETEHREVRSYLPSTPEQRLLQKAESKARRKASLSEADREEIRKRDRERKAKKREDERLIAWLKNLDFDLE